MSNQRPFSWFRLAPFGRQLQPAPAPPPAPRPTAFRAPAPQPFRPASPQPRPAIRPPAPPAITSPTPTAPTRALFPGITTTQQPAPRSPTPSTAPGSPAKSLPATSVPSSPIIKMALSSSPTSPTLLPITSSSFTLRSPETKTPAPKLAASPAKTAPPAATSTIITAPTTATTTFSARIVKPSNESPPKHPEKKPLFRSPTQTRIAPQEERKLMLGQETAGNSKMNEKSAMDNKKVSTKFEKLPRRVVTLIGENKGAIMVLNPNSTKKSYTNVFGGKSQTVGNKEEGEMGSKKKDDQHDMNTMEMEESTLFINSNVQGVNNSILDDSSLTEHDPGFHIVFSTD